MEKRLDQIGEKIREAATLGKSEIWLTSALPMHKEFEVDYQPYRNADFTPLQRLVEKELRRHGFTMKIELRETKIGGGFKSLDGETKIEMHPYLKVTW